MIAFSDANTDDPSRAELIQYRKQGVTVVALYRIEGGGHTEPSRRERYGRLYTRFVGPQNGDIEMAEEVWKFFSAQSGR